MYLYDKRLKFYSKKYIINNTNTSINNLLKRELDAKKYYNPQHFIIISSFISKNYMNNILFLSLNHPNKYVFRFLSNQILRILNININPYPEKLNPMVNGESCVIYESIKNTINKEFVKNRYSQRQLPNVNLITFLNFHYDKYSLIKNYLIEKYS